LPKCAGRAPETGWHDVPTEGGRAPVEYERRRLSATLVSAATSSGIGQGAVPQHWRG